MTRNEYLTSKKCIYCGDQLVFPGEIDEVDYLNATARDYPYRADRAKQMLTAMMGRRVCPSCSKEVVVKTERNKTRRREGRESDLECIRCGKKVGSKKNTLNDQFICPSCVVDINWMKREDNRNFLEYVATKRTNERAQIRRINESAEARRLLNRQDSFLSPMGSIDPKKPVPKDNSPRHYSTHTEEETGRVWHVEMRGHRGY